MTTVQYWNLRHSCLACPSPWFLTYWQTTLHNPVILFKVVCLIFIFRCWHLFFVWLQGFCAQDVPTNHNYPWWSSPETSVPEKSKWTYWSYHARPTKWRILYCGEQPYSRPNRALPGPHLHVDTSTFFHYFSCFPANTSCSIAEIEKFDLFQKTQAFSYDMYTLSKG